MSNILQRLNQQASCISEKDIDSWIVNDFLELYKNRIIFFAYKAYKTGYVGELSSVTIEAFRERVKNTLRRSLKTFFLKKQHWKSNRPVNPYLLKSISNLSKEIKRENTLASRILVCPACKQDGITEVLIPESNLWRCLRCSKVCDDIADNLTILKNKDLHLRYRLAHAFSLHSQKGYRCPDCLRFIPASIITELGIICPYSDCIFFGSVGELSGMAHPVTIGTRKHISLNSVSYTKQSGNNIITHQDLLKDLPSLDIRLNVCEKYKNELNILNDVINKQIMKVERSCSSGTYVQKRLMYEAYKNMISKYPNDMISYLVHRKQLSDFPIQARIFQEYVSLIINYLPFTIKKYDKTIDIISLTDSNLSLFLGISVFESVIDKNNIISNKTKEVYIGGRKNKNYGPCFIGWLIDVVNKQTGESLLKKVIRYGFMSIYMDKSVDSGIIVEVKHFRTPSHYEMNSLVYLQRIRRSIVDSVYFRLNHKKRKVKKG